MAEILEFIDPKAEKQIEDYLKSLQGIATSYNTIFSAAAQVDAQLTKTNKSQADAAVKQDSANKAAQEAAKIAKDQKSAMEALDKQRTAALIQIAKAEQKEKDLVTAMNMEVKSIKDANAQNSALRKVRNDLDVTTTAGIKKLEELNAKINKNTEFVRLNTDAGTKQAMNIGNYTSAFGKHGDAIDSIAEKLGGMPGPAGAAAQAVAGLGKQFLILLTNPIIAIIAGISAAIYILYSSMQRSEEGQNKLNSVMYEAKAVYNYVAESVGKLAISIFDLGSKSTGMVDKVKNIGEAWFELWKKTNPALIAFKALFGQTDKDLQKAVNDAHMMSILIAEDQKDDRKRELENAELSKKSSKLRADAMELRKTDAKAGLGMMKEAMEMDKKIAENDLSMAKDKAKIAQYHFNTNKKDTEALDELNKANIAVFAAEQNRDDQRGARVRKMNAMRMEDQKQEEARSATQIELNKLGLAETVRTNDAIIISTKSTAEAKKKALTQNATIEQQLLRQTQDKALSDLDNQLGVSLINAIDYEQQKTLIKAKYADSTKAAAEKLAAELLKIDNDAQAKALAVDLKNFDTLDKTKISNEIKLTDEIIQEERNRLVRRSKVQDAIITQKVKSGGMTEGEGTAERLALVDSIETAVKELKIRKAKETAEALKLLEKEREDYAKASAAEEQSVIGRMYDARVNALKAALLKGEITETEYNQRVLDAQFDANKASLKATISTLEQQWLAAEWETGEELDLWTKLQDAKQKLDNATTDNAVENEQRRKKAIMDTLNTIGSVGGQISDIAQGYFKNETDALAIEKDRQLALVGDNKVAQDEINKKFAIKEAEIKRKQAIAEQAAAIFSIAISTAKGIAEAIPNIPLMILAGVLGAAQMAIVAAQPLPEIPAFAKGVGSAPRGLALVGEAGREIITKNGHAQMISEPTMLKLQGGEQILNNKETERFLQRANEGRMGYDSADLKRSIEQGNKRIVTAINGKSELHISATGDRITERKGNFYKTYFNRKISWVGKRI